MEGGIDHIVGPAKPAKSVPVPRYITLKYTCHCQFTTCHIKKFARISHNMLILLNLILNLGVKSCKTACNERYSRSNDSERSAPKDGGASVEIYLSSANVAWSLRSVRAPTLQRAPQRCRSLAPPESVRKCGVRPLVSPALSASDRAWFFRSRTPECCAIKKPRPFFRRALDVPAAGELASRLIFAIGLRGRQQRFDDPHRPPTGRSHSCPCRRQLGRRAAVSRYGGLDN